MEERFLYLVKQQLANLISKEENQELQEILYKNQELAKVYEAIFTATESDDEDDLLESEQSYAAHVVRMHLDGAFEKDEKQEEPYLSTYTSPKPGKKYLAATTMLILAIVVYFIVPWSSNNAIPENQVGTRKGSKSHIMLPDGTSVWLNADSKITYPANFQGETREVSLIGEAFFDVVKNPAKPFIIHTGAMDVKVLGTVFNLRSYPGEMTTEAALLHGIIEVTVNGKEKKKIVLKPNEKITVLNNEDGYQKTEPAAARKNLPDEGNLPLLAITKIRFNQKDSSNAETSWVYNKLSFDNEDIDRVFSKIEQWYDIEIEVQDETIQSKHFTATFENKSLEAVMEALAMALNFAYTEMKGKIIIQKSYRPKQPPRI
jgi:transmembrane sensor